MSRSIKSFRTFEEAVEDEIQQARLRTPRERILLLHQLIRATMKFPILNKSRAEDAVPILRRRRDAWE